MSLSDRDQRLIEAQLVDLGKSIGASQRHRDQVLERATSHLIRQNTQKKTTHVALALAAAVLLISPLIADLTRRVKVHRPATAKQAQADALELTEAHQMSFDWALVDVFMQFRDRLRK
ncbi:hypothetical protein LOC67_03580 [Stieleria sp. JC731]|uniref:hypothetical protein n=1 Tax=Pirellulaceae TaxID=2691357 RepID=UPI001E29FB5A|nr:hypothetical protein [Stieleria sp. JC731]MCC9599630.1 hypothetical protein [Stieleria sp. JC731]